MYILHHQVFCVSKAAGMLDLKRDENRIKETSYPSCHTSQVEERTLAGKDGFVTLPGNARKESSGNGDHLQRTDKRMRQMQLSASRS